MPELSSTFLTFSIYRLQRSSQDIVKCLDRLTEGQILQRNADYENSIANLLLHLSGNMRQWIMHGIDGQPDVRTRDAEFGLAPVESAGEARARFAATIAEVCAILKELPEARLLAIIDPQPGSGWEAMTVLAAIYQVVGHVQHHAGQIILLTKQLVHSDLDLSIPRRR